MNNKELNTLRRNTIKTLKNETKSPWMREKFEYIINNGQLFNVVNATENVLKTNIDWIKKNWKNTKEFNDYTKNELGLEGECLWALESINNEFDTAVTDKLFNYVI